MTLEDRLRALATKGELVHLSIVARAGVFSATFAAASPAGGYAYGEDVDPIKAIESALAGIKVRARQAEKAPEREVTAAVTAPEPDAPDQVRGPEDALGGAAEHCDAGGFPSDWTRP